MEQIDLDGVEMVHLNGIAQAISTSSRQATRRLAERGRAAGAVVAFDLNFRPQIWDGPAAAEAADEWAEYGAACGVELSYHIHTNTLVDSAADWRRYMNMLQRAQLCIDVSHAQLWGVDPVAAIREFAPRLNYVHLQDYSTSSRDADGTYQPVWCDVGESEAVDFPAVLKTLAELDFRRWVTACPRRGDDPLREARRSRKTRDYLRRLGY